MQGYQKKLVTFNLIKLNILSFVISIIAAGITIPLNIFIFKPPKTAVLSLFSNALLSMLVGLLILLAVFLVSVVLHELLHALGFLCTKGVSPKHIKFGVDIKKGIAYCSVSQPLRRNQYIFAGLLPAFVTLIALIVTMIFTDYLWVAIASLLLGACAGDFEMFFSVMRYPKNQLFLDHPTLPAYYLLYPDDALPEGFVADAEQTDVSQPLKSNTSALEQTPTDEKEGKASAPSKPEKKKNHLLLFMIALVLFGIVIGLVVALT